jgi:hypothetical protein
MGGPNTAPGGTDFVFFLTNVAQLHESERHFKLSSEEIALLNPNTRTCPIFRSKRDAEITKAIYRRIPVLIEESKGDAGNPWGISIRRVLDMGQESISKQVRTRKTLEQTGIFRMKNLDITLVDDSEYVPIYEGKMFQAFNHRAAGVIFNSANIIRGAQGIETHNEQLKDPAFIPEPLYWFPKHELLMDKLFHTQQGWLLGYKNITSPTNERSMLATIFPLGGSNFSIRIVFFRTLNAQLSACFLAVMNTFIYDYLLRQSLGGVNLSDYICHQLPALKPSTYENTWPSPNGTQKLRDWVLRRVQELTYTSWDVASFAQNSGNDGPPFVWDEERRFKIRCELDALYFHLYGINRNDADYILETFPIVKRKDIAQYGEYRTKNLILQIYDAMQCAKETSSPYQTILDPPPADPRCCHPARET